MLEHVTRTNLIIVDLCH